MVERIDHYAKGWEAALVHVRHIAVACEGDMETFLGRLDKALLDARRKYSGDTIYNKGWHENRR